ncbi:MAG TPA: hypothetical protein VNN79_02845 [Actinomycetota bacterium]|nr:hypothetical protein [Actinomycetota bacterium]
MEGAGEQQLGSRRLRTPRAAAAAGIAFSLLLTASLSLLILARPANAGDIGSWLSDSGRRAAIRTAIALVPFAGIAFLWFIGVVRDRIGHREDRFFATVFLGSGLLFVALLFVAAAVGGVVVVAESNPATKLSPQTLGLARGISSVLLHTFALRMAAVFTISASTILRSEGVGARWVAYAGYVAGLLMLIGLGLSPWIELVFPSWVLVVSVDILVRSARGQAPAVALHAGQGPA